MEICGKVMIWKEISPYFQPHEVFSPEIMAKGYWHLVNLEMLRAANRTRDILGYPCYINHDKYWLRGVVSASEVLTRDGAKYTTHVQGHAIDLSCYDVTIDELAAAMKEAGFKYLIKYRSWVHGDMAERGRIII